MISAILCGCNSDSHTQEIKDNPIEVITESENPQPETIQEDKRYFPSLTSLYDIPYKTPEYEEVVSKVVFENINGSIDGVGISGKPNSIQGGYIYQIINESKSFSDYEFSVSISYRYAIYMEIYLGDYCVMAKYWRNKWLFSDNLLECMDYLSNPPYLEYSEFIDKYGDMSVKKGRNFNAHLRRDYTFVGDWAIH